MRSILSALAWEFWMKARWRALLAVGASAGLCALIVHGISMGNDSPDLPKFAVMIRSLMSTLDIFAFVAFILISQSDVEGRHTGFMARLYALPLATRPLVAMQMILGAGTVFLMSAATTLLFAAYCGVYLSPWGLALFAALAMAWSQAIVWALPDFRFGRVAAMAAVWSGLIYSHVLTIEWMKEMDAAAREIPMVWTGWPVWVYGLMAAGIVAAYGVAVWGVGRDRRGDAQGLVALRTLWARWRAGRPWRTAPFASPARALFWAECRQKLYFMPLAIGVFGFFFVLLGALRVSRPPEMLELLLGVVVFGPLYGAFFFGLLLGRSGGFGRRARIDTFTATLPVPDRRLSAAVLKTGVTSLLLTWAIGAVWIGIVCQALWAIGEGDTVRHVWREIGLADHSFRELSAIVTLGVTSAWALLAIGTTLTLTGRPAAIGVVAAFIILGLVLPAFAALGGEHVARVYVEILSVGTIAFWLLGTFAAYAVALRRGHVGAGLAFSALALWLALTAWLLFDVSAKGNIHWPGLLALLAFAAAVLSPPAAAPLALAWNRHR